MSLITQINKLFSKAEPKHIIGISLTEDSLGFCYIPDGAIQHQMIAVTAKNNLNKDKNSYVEVIEKLSAELNISAQCRLVLPVSQYHIVQIEKPNVPVNEIAAALKWQVKDLVPFIPEDMIVDYFEGPNLAGGTSKLNVVCASKTYLQSLLEPLTDTDIRLKVITTEEFAFASLLPVQDDACLLICQQPNEEIVLLIVKEGQLYFHRRLRGFSQISQRSEQELETGIIDTLSLEIQRSTDYFERQLKQPPIKKIHLMLPISTEHFLVEKLSENTRIPVSLLDLPEAHQKQRQLAVAIGATMLNRMEQSV